MGETDRWNTSLCDMPFIITRELMLSLDTGEGWMKLAEAALFNFDAMMLLTLEQKRQDGSPTKKLLWELGCQGYTLYDLNEKLKQAGRIKESRVVEKHANMPPEKKGAMGGYNSGFTSLPSKASQQQLESLISRLYSPKDAMDKKAQSSISSDYNINRSTPQAKNFGKGHYDDKIIPGTDQSLNPGYNNGSQMTAHPDLGGGQTTLSTAETRQDLTYYLPSSSMGGISLATSGAENIQPLLIKTPSPSMQSSTPPQLKSNLSVTSGAPPSNSSSSNPSSPGEVDFALSVKPNYSMKELHECTQGFAAHNLLGEGAFGRVYKGNLRTMDCAIKVLKQEGNESLDKVNQLTSELTTVLKFQNDHIVTLYGYALEGCNLCLVYQYLPNGSLEDRLALKNHKDPIPWERRLNIMVGAAKGLNFLHTMGNKTLIHGDIKSANILLDKYLEAKLGDLGQAQYATAASSTTKMVACPSGFTHITMEHTSSKQFGTKAYLPHDLLTTGQISVKSDVYALGVVFLEVCTGLKAYDQSRTDSFLSSHVKSIMADRNKNADWLGQLMDPKAGHLPPDIFADVLKISKRCVADLKKQRPDSVKLLNEVSTIYKKYETLKQDMGSSFESSLMSSLQISTSSQSDSQPPASQPGSSLTAQPSDSGPLQPLSRDSLLQTDGSLTSDGSTMSCYKSHTSHGQYVPDVMAGNAPSSSYFPHEQSVSCQAVKPDINQPPNAATSPESPINSFPPGHPLPEPFRLQEAYDKQTEKKKIEQLSSSTTDGPNLQPNSFSADTPGFETLPAADPRKLAELNAFDSQNLGSNESEADFTNIPADPKKMAMLQDFDNNLATSTDLPGNNNPSTHTCQTGGGDLTSQETFAYQPNCHMTSETMSKNITEVCNQTLPVSDARRESDVDNNAVLSPEDVGMSTKRANLFDQYELLAQQVQNGLNVEENDQFELNQI